MGLLKDILECGHMTDLDGCPRPISAHVSENEGRFLQELFRRYEVQSSLEIGCAFGISSLYMCEVLQANPRATHTIIDPKQSKLWGGIGRANLERAGHTFVEFIEDRSELIMPELVRAGRIFDFVFIDGFHTFDHTLVDLFYASRLIDVGGIIAIDDCTMPSVGKAVRYMRNLPCYAKLSGVKTPSRRRRLVSAVARVIPEKAALSLLPPCVIDRAYPSETMVALRKISPDNREWNWYADF